MGISLVDVDTEKLIEKCNWWNWRTTVEIIRSINMMDNERCDLLSDGFGELSLLECQQISEHIKKQIIPTLTLTNRIKFDLTLTKEPDDGRVYTGDDWQKSYSTSLEWLEKFVKALDSTTNGLLVSQ